MIGRCTGTVFAAIGKRGNLTELSTRGFGASLLLAEFSFASPKAVAFEREDLGVVGEAVDERDGARGVGEDGVPALERQIGWSSGSRDARSDD